MYRYQRIQRGRGLGAFFSNILRIFSKTAPIIKKVVSNPTVKKIGKNALGSALLVGADILKGENAKESLKKELSSTKSQVGEELKKISEKVKKSKTTEKRKSNQKASKDRKRRRVNIEDHLF